MSISPLVAIPTALMLASPIVSAITVTGEIGAMPEPTETTITQPLGEETTEAPLEPVEQLTDPDSTPEPVVDSEPLQDDTDALEEGWVTRDAIVTFDDGEEWTVTITKNENGNYILERSW